MSTRMWRSLREPLTPASGTWGSQRACKSPISLHSLVVSSCQDTMLATTMLICIHIQGKHGVA